MKKCENLRSIVMYAQAACFCQVNMVKQSCNIPQFPFFSSLPLTRAAFLGQYPNSELPVSLASLFAEFWRYWLSRFLPLL